MTVISMSPRDFHKRVTRLGCRLVRHGRHAVYEAPSGHTFAAPHQSAGRRHTVITGAIVRSAARALGIPTKDLMK